MDRHRKSKQLAQYAKNPGKTRVLQRRGQEPNVSPFFLCFFAAGRKNHPSNDSADPASNEPLRISLGIVAESGAGVDRVSKMLAEPLML